MINSQYIQAVLFKFEWLWTVERCLKHKGPHHQTTTYGMRPHPAIFAAISSKPPTMVNTEALSAAIADLRSQKKPNFFATARKHGIDRTTLRRRFQGKQAPRGVSHIEAQGHLSVKMEEVLIERINTLSARGLPPTPQFIANMVLELSGEQVGPNWVSRFVKRHDDDLSSIYLESIDYARRIADNSKHFKDYFEKVSAYLNLYWTDLHQLQASIQKHRIKPSNLYNMDEKGFLIKLCGTKRRIVAKEMLRKKKLLGASQDGSREFISLLACICADGTALPPALIYEGKSHDLQDTWLEDFDASVDEAYFIATAKGWTRISNSEPLIVD